MANGSILAASDEELQQIFNPLTEDDLNTLREVDRIADAVHPLMLRGEMAGMDMARHRQELQELQQQARGLLAAFGSEALPASGNPIENP